MGSISELKGKYSPMEGLIFDVLRRTGFPLPADQTLLREVYPRKNEQPFHAQIVINRAVTTLGKKLQHNREVLPARTQAKAASTLDRKPYHQENQQGTT